MGVNGRELTVDDLVGGLLALDIGGNARAGGAGTAALARSAWVSVSGIGGVEPEHVGVVLCVSLANNPPYSFRK